MEGIFVFVQLKTQHHRQFRIRDGDLGIPRITGSGKFTAFVSEIQFPLQFQHFIFVQIDNIEHANTKSEHGCGIVECRTLECMAPEGTFHAQKSLEFFFRIHILLLQWRLDGIFYLGHGIKHYGKK